MGVIAGKVDLATYKESDRRNITKWIMYPNYLWAQKKNDICLLILEKPLVFTKNVQKIDLDLDGTVDGESCTISGFGATKVESFSAI